MNLKVFNPSTTTSRKHRSFISFYNRGFVRLSHGLTIKHKLKDGDTIEFAQDERNPLDWYVRFNKGGFKLRANKHERKDIALCFSAAGVSREILDTIGKTDASIRVSSEPNEMGWYSLLTAEFNG